MAKRKQNNLSPQAAKIIGLLILFLVVGWLVVETAVHFLNQSNYFKVKKILLDPTLEFMNKADVEKLKGGSIFSIDLNHYQQMLAQKYPQVLQLRVERHFPDQIHVVAKARIPVAQIQLARKVLTLDNNALILSTTTERDDKFPLITGLDVNHIKTDLGQSVNSREVNMAIAVIKAFRESKGLANFSIKKIDVTNLSAMEMTISNDLKIMVDRENLAMKMQMLGILLSKDDFNPAEIKYVDLRFKEPIIGKKETPPAKRK